VCCSNSQVCAEHPQIVSHGTRARLAGVAHGQSNSQFARETPPDLDIDGERAYLTDVVETIAAVTGTCPRGWLGPLASCLTSPKRVRPVP